MLEARTRAVPQQMWSVLPREHIELCAELTQEFPNGRDVDNSAKISDQQLQAYLDEGLPATLMSHIEQLLRTDSSLQQRLGQVAGQREAGVHGLGEIWRRQRLSCPSREQLGSFILGAIDPELEDYIRFHLEQVGCRYCAANLEDLADQKTEQQSTAQTRRRKYFQTSVGHLKSG